MKFKNKQNLPKISSPSKSSILSSSGQDHPKVCFFFNFLIFIGFYNVDVNLKDKTGEGLIIMAIGDMNNDKHADIVTVNN